MQESTETTRQLKQQMQKDLSITRWQKTGVRTAIKSALLEKKVMALLQDSRLSNKELHSAIRKTLASPSVQRFVEGMKERQTAQN
jgi:hypothetical protein